MPLHAFGNLVRTRRENSGLRNGVCGVFRWLRLHAKRFEIPARRGLLRELRGEPSVPLDAKYGQLNGASGAVKEQVGPVLAKDENAEAVKIVLRAHRASLMDEMVPGPA